MLKKALYAGAVLGAGYVGLQWWTASNLATHAVRQRGGCACGSRQGRSGCYWRLPGALAHRRMPLKAICAPYASAEVQPGGSLRAVGLPRGCALRAHKAGGGGGQGQGAPSQPG